MKQFNDLFKMLLDAYKEFNQLLGDDQRGRDDNWFDDVDTKVCSFKRKVHCWLTEAAQRVKTSKCSSRSSRSVSNKEIGKNCIQLPSELGFRTAKQLLTQRFGDLHIITASYRKEIKQWPQIKAGDDGAYRRFQNFLVKCENIDHLQS